MQQQQTLCDVLCEKRHTAILNTWTNIREVMLEMKQSTVP